MRIELVAIYQDDLSLESANLLDLAPSRLEPNQVSGAEL